MSDMLIGIIILVMAGLMFLMVYFMHQNNENGRKVREYEQREKDNDD